MQDFHVEFNSLWNVFLGHMVDELFFEIDSEFYIIDHPFEILSLLPLATYALDFRYHETLIFILASA